MMQPIAAFFASIIAFVSGLFGSPLLASNSPINIPTAHPAAAAAAHTEVVGDPFNDPAAASPVAAAFAAASSASASPSPSQGRVLGEQTTSLAPFLSQFSTFLRSFDAYLASPLASGGTAYPRYGGYVPSTGGTTALASPTITGGTISNASSGSFDALSAGTLNLSGTLTGTDATFSGTLTAGTLNVAGITSQGALIGPYFTATSTTATSTFAGAVGIGTTTALAMLDITGTNSQATIGSEMIVATADADFSSNTGNWTGTNWTIGSGVATHTAGANALTLSNTALSSAPANDNIYQVTYTLTTTVAGTMTVSFGGVSQTIVGQAVGTDAQTQVFLATGTGVLTFTPSAAWTGTVDNVSIKQITPSDAVFALHNSDGSNSAIAFRSGKNTGSDSSNLLIGSDVGKAITSGQRNTAIGRKAFITNTTGTFNTALGDNTLLYNTTGGNNTALGALVLSYNTTGSSNTTVGLQSMFFNTTGTYNSAFGVGALSNNKTGSSNSTFGISALYYNGTGSNNSIFGSQAGIGASGTNISNNSIFGAKAGFSNITGADNNTLVGYQAGYDVTTGAYNIVLGAGTTTGVGLTTGSNNILIGNGVNAGLSRTGSNQLNIGNLIFGTGLAASSTPSSGNVGIGTTSPWGKLSVQAADNNSAPQFVVASSTATSLFVGANGNVGIGTTSPLNQAEIVGSGGSVGTGWINTHYSGGASTPIPYSVGRGARGTADSPSAIKANDYMFIIGGRGMGSTTFSSINRAAISFKAAEDWSDTVQGSMIDFETAANGGTSRTTKMRITDAGNLGIGTTTPWGKLSITGSGTGTGLAFAVADSANTPRFVIQDNGNIGIGTTTPSARLDVGGYGSNELGFTPNNAIRLFDNYNGISDISIKNINTNITAASAFQAFDSGGSYVSLTMPGTGNTAAPLFGLARASTTYLFSNTVGANPARNLAIGTLGANSLTLGTNNAARLTIDSSGNVGIGTTSPFRKFEVAGSSGESSGGPIMALYATNGFTNARRFSIQNGVDATSNYLGFNVENDAGAVASTPLTIRTSGNVGIGTTTPWGKLSIKGSGTGTGLAFAVADSANTPRFVIQDNGNVGIGQTSPGAKLAIQQSGGAAGDLLHFRDSSDTNDLVLRYNGDDWEFRSELSGEGTPFLSFDSSTGNVGIGTTSPGA